MKALAIIGFTIGGGVIGGLTGAYVGDKRGKGDYNFAPLFDGAIGMIVGGLVGVVAGSVVFAR